MGNLPPDLWPAIGVTLKLASCTTILLLLLAMPLAHWLVHSRNPLRGLVDLLVSLPIVLPPTVIGFYLLILMAPHAPLGSVWQSLVGSPLPFSFAGLVVGSVIYSLPFAVQPIQTAFRSVEPGLIEAAIAVGAPARRVYRSIVIPSSWHGIASAAALAFAHTVGEFGVVLMLGGNIPGKTRVASIALYDQVQQLNYDGANAFALILVVISLVLLALVALIRRNHAVDLPRLR
ncbi:MAG: molybdate ABC transporter permease subunit [Burkholderiales bacterium]|nr:molybdate ABC transporter permease subunit [Burkholderiales bacterium]